jgi:Glyoxalase-like domain
MTRTVRVVIDCRDPAALGQFWLRALGYVEKAAPEGYESWSAYAAAILGHEVGYVIVDPDGVGPLIFFQPVPEPKTGKNRVHLDVEVRGDGPPEQQWQRIRNAVAPLEALGATVLRRNEDPNDYFITMADPEGNEFCLV